MEDFMQNQITPKRLEDQFVNSASRPNAQAVHSRYQTMARSLPMQQIIQQVADSNSATNVHMQTEEGIDGAQAIENESDITDEADASSPPPLHLVSPLKMPADALMYH